LKSFIYLIINKTTITWMDDKIINKTTITWMDDNTNVTSSNDKTAKPYLI